MFRREINTISMLPPATRDKAEMKELQRVLTIELQACENIRNSILGNSNITTCDEHGISVFESDMGIIPLGTDTLEERITRCLITWNNSLPYNYNTIIALLNSTVGEGNYTVHLEELELEVKVDIGSTRQIETIVSGLRDIIPANVLLTTSIITNKWSDVSTRIWGSLAGKKWSNIMYDKEYRREI